MLISVELSLYPLAEDFKPFIREYIAALQQHHTVDIFSNTMSTQLFGEYDDVMNAVQSVTKAAFERDPSMVLIAKILSGDRHPNR